MGARDSGFLGCSVLRTTQHRRDVGLVFEQIQGQTHPRRDAPSKLGTPGRVMPDPRGPQFTPPTIVNILKEGSYSVGDLAIILDRSHHSIGKSLRRLREKGKVEIHHGGFKLKS